LEADKDCEDLAFVCSLSAYLGTFARKMTSLHRSENIIVL